MYRVVLLFGHYMFRSQSYESYDDINSILDQKDIDMNLYCIEKFNEAAGCWVVI